MTITSIGYDGTIDETQFERVMGYTSAAKYGVDTSAAFRASTVAGQVLQTSLTPGIAWTAGLVDEMHTAETVQLAPVANGSRWDMIVLRRDYQPPSGQTSLAIIQGSASKAIPARNTNSGVLEDQPLWLVRIDAGKSTPSEYVDLRVFARNGGCTANDEMVRSYMNALGTQIEINGKLWLRRPGSNGLDEWADLTSLLGLAKEGHSHDTLYSNDAVTSLSLGKDGAGAYVKAPAITGREYDAEPNMYVTAAGVLGRGTRSPVRLYDRGAVINVGIDSIGEFVQSETIRTRRYDADANVVITSNGVLGISTRATSAKKYKRNIRDHAIDPAAVLALRPVIYDRPDGARDEFGVIADESAESLPELVGFVDGEIESFHYDRLPVAQQFVLRDHEARIEKLEAALAAALTRLEELSN